MTIKIRFRGKRHPTSGELISLTKRQARQLQRRVLLGPVISLPLPRGATSTGTPFRQRRGPAPISC